VTVQYELDRRLRAAGTEVIALACHPGVVDTDLFATRSRPQQFLLSPAMRMINFWAVQNARMGALPTLRVATDPSARGGEYFGPRRYGLRRRFYTGYPAVVDSSARSYDEADQAPAVAGVGAADRSQLRRPRLRACQPRGTVIAERGVRGFSLAEATRRLGVTTAAPYRHFADRDELLAAAAARALSDFAAMLEVAADTPAQRLAAMAGAYVRFAAEQRPLFDTIFNSGLDKSAIPSCSAPGNQWMRCWPSSFRPVTATRPQPTH
jgi:hypothetical protein